RLGGKHGDLHGAPIELAGGVRALTHGRVVLPHMMRGVRIDLRPSAPLPCDRGDVIVASKPVQNPDAEIFLPPRIDAPPCTVIGLKSSAHFRAGFRDIAGAILTADAPGLTTNKVEVFDHQRAGRALWPSVAEH